MIVAIHQPDYIPYPGYFYKIMNCNCFVFLDDVQYSNEGFTNWNKVKTPQGEHRLKIPVNQTLGDTIMQVTTKDELGWKQKQLKILAMNYRRAKYFDEVYNDLKTLFDIEYENIAEQNIAILKHICNKFGVKQNFIRSSELTVGGKKEEKVLNLCEVLGATTYLSGQGAKVYQKVENFTKRGIKLQYSTYVPIEYHQLWGEFIGNLSIIDYLFCYGYDWEYIDDWQKRNR